MEKDADIKTLLEAKIKELDDLKRRLPSYNDRKAGLIKHNDNVSLWQRIEEIEEEIERLRAGG